MKLRLLYGVFFLLATTLPACSFTWSRHPIPTSTATDIHPVTTALEQATITALSEASATPNLHTTETKTPMPTLAPSNQVEFIKELLANNGECILPCFWGIVPGTTYWDDASNFLRTFGEVKEGKYYSVTIRKLDSARDILIEFKVKEGIVTEIKAGPSVTKNFTIDKMLNEYGTPKDIYLLTFRNSPSPTTPAFIVLNYESQGVLAEYEFVSNKINNTEFSICAEPVGPNLWLRSPEQMITEQDINHLILGTEPAYSLRKIDEVTDIAAEEFYDEFKGLSACFITQIDNWP